MSSSTTKYIVRRDESDGRIVWAVVWTPDKTYVEHHPDGQDYTWHKDKIHPNTWQIAVDFVAQCEAYSPQRRACVFVRKCVVMQFLRERSKP